MNIAELEARAKKALNPGEEKAFGCLMPCGPAMRDYREAADPATVLALIARLREAQNLLAEAAYKVDSAGLVKRIDTLLRGGVI